MCHASKYRRSSRGSRESRQSCVQHPVAAWSIVSIGETLDRARKIGGKKKRECEREAEEMEKEERSMRSTMSRVIRTFPRDDLARVCGVAVLASKEKKMRCLYNESVSTQMTRDEKKIRLLDEWNL